LTTSETFNVVPFTTPSTGLSTAGDEAVGLGIRAAEVADAFVHPMSTQARAAHPKVNSRGVI
jgi:hypothetical protein